MIIISFSLDDAHLMRDEECIVLNTTIMASRSLNRGKRLVELEDGRVNISESLLFGDFVYNERNNLHKST